MKTFNAICKTSSGTYIGTYKIDVYTEEPIDIGDVFILEREDVGGAK